MLSHPTDEKTIETLETLSQSWYAQHHAKEFYNARY